MRRTSRLRGRLAPWIPLICAALMLPACIAYRQGASGRALAMPQTPEAPKKSISVLIRARASYRGNERQLPPYILSQWKQAVLLGFRESGLFSEVREGIGRTTDLQASVQIENTLQASRGLGFLAAISFLVVPTRNDDAFELSTTLTDPSGAVLARLASTESVTTWYQIFLLPATPFLSRDVVVSDTLYDLTLDTAAQAQQKGLL
jgi:hypothetical protein